MNLFTTIRNAALLSDFTAALQSVQGGLGVKSGDYAGAHFSASTESAWPAMTAALRETVMAQYACGELQGEFTK